MRRRIEIHIRGLSEMAIKELENTKIVFVLAQSSKRGKGDDYGAGRDLLDTACVNEGIINQNTKRSTGAGTAIFCSPFYPVRQVMAKQARKGIKIRKQRRRCTMKKLLKEEKLR